jgi:hypothetical protein
MLNYLKDYKIENQIMKPRNLNKVGGNKNMW